MCSHYEAPSNDRLIEGYGIAPETPGQTEIWPCYMGPFLRRRPEEAHDDDQLPLEILTGQFGLLPAWAKDRKLGRHTYNARSETVAQKPSYREAWKQAQHCIIPAVAIYEPDWRSGNSVPTRISRADGGVLGIAGIWERWESQGEGVVHSFSMLTVNADDHEFMRNYHRPEDEKRMVVILPNGSHQDWLNAKASDSMDFMVQYPADRLLAEPRPS